MDSKFTAFICLILAAANVAYFVAVPDNPIRWANAAVSVLCLGVGIIIGVKE